MDSQWTVALSASRRPARLCPGCRARVRPAGALWRRGISPVPLALAVLPRQPPVAMAVASRLATLLRGLRATTSIATCLARQCRKQATLQLGSADGPRAAGLRIFTRCSQYVAARSARGGRADGHSGRGRDAYVDIKAIGQDIHAGLLRGGQQRADIGEQGTCLVLSSCGGQRQPFDPAQAVPGGGGTWLLVWPSPSGGRHP